LVETDAQIAPVSESMSAGRVSAQCGGQGASTNNTVSNEAGYAMEEVRILTFQKVAVGSMMSFVRRNAFPL